MEIHIILFFFKKHYETIISLSLMTFIIILFSCNSDYYNSPTQYNDTKITKDNNLLLCCNDINPYSQGCDQHIWSLKCNDAPPCTTQSDIEISCECCKEYWDRYGQGGSVPCTVPCPDNIWPKLHRMETTNGGNEL